MAPSPSTTSSGSSLSDLKNPQGERLHFILFRGPDASRSFEFSTTTFYRLVFGGAFLLLLCIGLTFGFIHYYFKARILPYSKRTAPAATMVSQNELMETKEVSPGVSPGVSHGIPSGEDSSIQELRTENAQLREALSQGKSQESARIESADSLPFSAFGQPFKRLPEEQVPIEISVPQVVWNSKGANVNFNIQYTHSSPGPQTGKILVIARGASFLSVYPASAFSPAVSPPVAHALIRLAAGETFSVSRFRQVFATFQGIQKNQIQNFEILLIDNSQQILIHEIVSAQSSPGDQKNSQTVTPKTPPTSAPEKKAVKAEEKQINMPSQPGTTNQGTVGTSATSGTSGTPEPEL